MEVLYVAQFDAAWKTEAGHERDVLSVLLQNAAMWLVYRTNTRPDSLDLDSDGSFSRLNGGRASWTNLSDGENRVFRLVVREPEVSSVVFETRITLALIQGAATARVSLARESIAPGLSPVADPIIVQPAFVLNIASDPRIILSAEGAVQDGRYLLVHSDAEAREVARALMNSSRLPILIMHPQNQQQWEAAKTVAKRLVGLVRVVVAGYRYTRIINQELPSVAVPFGGAVLVWSRLLSPPRLISRDELSALGDGGLRRSLMTQLAELSVRARGSDLAWSRMRQIHLSEGAATAAQRAAEAASAGNVAAQVEALDSQVAALNAQLEDAEELTNSYAADAQRAQDDLQAASRARIESEAKVEALRYQIGQMGHGVEANTDVSYDDIPALDPKDATETFRLLEERSEGRIAFTPNAFQSWKKASLTNYEQMTSALISLTLLANSLYDGSTPAPKIDGRTDDWIHSEFGITVTYHDTGIETHKKAPDSFEFEGAVWNNVPHVKVTDAVPWSQVARIHFDQDEEGGRIIVNHVGHKLYK